MKPTGFSQQTANLVRRRSTLFRRERMAWTVFVAYVLVLWATLVPSFNLYVAIYDRVGRETVSFWMNAGVATVAGIVGLAAAWVYRPRPSGYALLAVLGAALAFCLDNLPIPAKRFHFMQYGPLAVLALDALRFRVRGMENYIWALVLVVLVGLGDEVIQHFLPDRYFGFLDVMVNTLAGAMALAFVGGVLRDENYPWPARGQRQEE